MNILKHLKHIRIIMIGTTLPANIGSAARAMHTMGLSDLVVVNPRLPIDETSHANAAGATSVLNNAVIVNTPEEALADCSLIFAASARTRHLPRPVVSPKQSADILTDYFSQHDNSQRPKVAILFGREDRGLTNDELAIADYHIQIPANPDYPVLNVASAIQVISSFIYDAFYQMTQLTPKNAQQHECQPLMLTIRQDWDEPAITHAQKQALNDAVVDLMTRLDLADANHLKNLPQRLSRLTSRLQLDQKEHALLRALIAKITQKLNPT
ncbi:RNA methyltransferase [Moraxella sp. Tifton1]|uniref:RNA methyltransferase n=1 Tax=Moraxella oculi TaxID=2940516 RepID=UPI002012F6E5|nr:RNA methyltransferase [Moraxella sp. Tifton1]MCL1623364.1 RNA methyltransferase [Moraxella sp. Tifton1]